MLDIKNIIFDLGQVIIQVDHEKTYSALEKISGVRHAVIENIFKDNDFLQFELGNLSEEEFFSRLKKHLDVDKEEIFSFQKAWNSMIIRIPFESVALLKNIRKKYSLYALSNTNVTHLKAINYHLGECHQIKNIKELFDQVYYSFELGLSKPDKKIFEYVILQDQLDPCRTLFIDDNGDNIKTAKKVGLQTIYLTQQENLVNELEKKGILLEIDNG